MQAMTRILDAVLKPALIGLVVLMVAAVSWQVISRYVFSAPSSWTEEIARFLLIWIGVLGAAYAFRTGVHLGLDVLPKKLSGMPQAALKHFSLSVVMLFSVTVLIIGGGSLVSLTWELRQYSAVLGLPMAFVYSVIPLAGLLICLYAIAAATGVELRQVDEPPDAEE